MKLLLKLLLFLIVLSAGIYAATPLWLPLIFASQLPPGWQLETLDTGYPGVSGISIHTLRVKGELQAAGIALTTSDTRFSFRGPRSDIGSLSLDIFVRATEDRTADALTLDDLSLPSTKLTGNIPEISVNQMQATVHHNFNIEPGESLVPGPLVLDFQAFKLIPGADNSFHLTSGISIEGIPAVTGQLDVDVSANSRNAIIRFPAADNLPAWMTVSLEQRDQALKNTTRIHAAFDAGPTDREWLEMILARSTGGILSQVSGKLEAQANFAGRELQGIESLSLAVENLQAEIENNPLTLNAKLLASREGEAITVTLPENTEIRYADKTGKLADLLVSIVPGLQRSPRPLEVAHGVLGASSRFVIQPDTEPSLEFSGDINLGLTSDESNAVLQASDLQVVVEDLSRLGSTSANGLVTVNWVEGKPIAYTLTDEHSAPMTIAVDEMDIQAQLTLSDSNLLSTGGGFVTGGHIESLATSATRVDFSWQELDLLKLAGKLSTKTQGFSAELEGEQWTGFDVDVTYTLAGDTDVDGSGVMKFDNGPELPIEFAGNIQAGQWNLKLPATTIKLAELDSLLAVAHFELPDSVKLSDGYIDMQGDATVDEEITAKLAIKGHEMSASMLESSVEGGSFNFDARYGATISASGPVSATSALLAGGIEVSDIGADLNLDDAETYGVRNMHAEVFGGQFKLDSLQFSGNRIEDTTAKLTHIDLGQLLAYTGIYGLEGSGLLEVSLPVGSDQTGIYIKNGSFNSVGPGRLAYTKEGIAVNNIGMQALENFHYQDFSGTLDYQSNGDYQIAIHLEGKNPDLYDGHPVLFNLNIGGSLPQLFEAMFITGSFEEAILNQIRTD